MTRYTPLWLQAGDYPALLDRQLIAALYPDARTLGLAVKPAGAGMDVTIDPGTLATPTANATGSVLAYSDALETVGIQPAPPTGTDRMDIVYAYPRGADLDGGTYNDLVFLVAQGTESPPPAQAPTGLVPGGAVALAVLTIHGGAASITAADITDSRPKIGQLAVPPAPVAPAYPPNPPPLIGWQDHARGSINAGTSDGGVRALPQPLVPSTLLLIMGGAHGYGTAASTANYTLKRQTPATNLIGSGAVQVPAASTYGLPTLFWSGDINPGEVWNLFITVTISGSNNYFSPKVGYVITPK